jgi:hypothetical protein
MLRFPFNDELLKEFSYKGQKKKKVFSVLATCSLIFGKKDDNIKVSVLLRLNSLETLLINVYEPESTRRDKSLLVAETACVASGHVHSCS